MRLGVILPNTKLYGGVKRFVELGNVFVDKGHEFHIFSPEGEQPNWMTFKGETHCFEDLQKFELDAIFFTEPRFLELIEASTAKRKIFYYVRKKEKLNLIAKHVDIEVFACSKNLKDYSKKKFDIDAFEAYGGIDTSLYNFKNENKAKDDFTVMVYGRIAEGRKGTKLVVRACERLRKAHPHIKLLLYDTPVNEKMQAAIDAFNTKVGFDFVLNHPFEKNCELFHRANVFVSAEKGAGWCNTAAEAMASGIPVIATESGTQNFLFHKKTGLLVKRNVFSIKKAISRLIINPELSETYRNNAFQKIQEFSWQTLAEKILTHLQ